MPSVRWVLPIAGWFLVQGIAPVMAAELSFEDMRVRVDGLHSARYAFPEGRKQSPEIHAVFEAASSRNQTPSLLLRFRSAQTWSHEYLAFEVENEESDDQMACIAVNQDRSGVIDQTFLAGCFTVLARQKINVLVPLKQGGAFGLEGALGEWLLPRKWQDALDREQVRSIRLSVVRPHRSWRMRFAHFRLLSGVRLTALVDEFGQFSRGEWPGKVRNFPDWEALRREESRSFLAWPQSWSRYGGDAAAVVSTGTGHFRVEKAAGRWSLIDPDGHRFFSIGMNDVSWDHWTPIEDRRAIFNALPEDHLEQLNGRQAANFYRANLDRLGEGSSSDWSDRVGRRLRTWGFNTLGIQRSASLRLRAGIPYTEILDVAEKTSAMATVPRIRVGEVIFPDAFDPAFEKAVTSMLGSPAYREMGEDPFLVGIFSDNEIRWTADQSQDRWALSREILLMRDGRSAKKAAIEMLKKRYPSLLALNQAWKVQFAGRRIADLEYRALVLPRFETPQLKRDLEDLLGLYSEAYFSSVRRAMGEAMPGTLYLGARFDRRVTPEVVVRSAAPHLDVLSFNWYSKGPESAELALLAGLDKPVLFSEFHFGATDRGAFQGGRVTVSDQEERGIAYTRYADRALELPFCVGFHWSGYLDDPVAGRWPGGENYNRGFVSVTDLAYRELASWASGWNRAVYERIGRWLE